MFETEATNNPAKRKSQKISKKCCDLGKSATFLYK
jgi:hypothetical protein